jgi:hypothetical protein
MLLISPTRRLREIASLRWWTVDVVEAEKELRALQRHTLEVINPEAGAPHM